MKKRQGSPLRYPGGKAVLASFLKKVIYENSLQGSTYIEPFAGGMGAGIELLIQGHVDRIVINDADRAVYSFWNSVRRNSKELISRIQNVPLSVEEWRRQRAIYRSGRRQKQIDLGFAAFYLNRCNRSGIIKNGGPIGGIEQAGKWKIDARFNREELSRRIEQLASFEDRIEVANEDAISLMYRLEEFVKQDRVFLYVDPPYYVKGRELYLSFFNERHHDDLAKALGQLKYGWILTYDDIPETRALYREHQIFPFRLRYSAHKASIEGGEILVAPHYITVSNSARDLLRALAK